LTSEERKFEAISDGKKNARFVMMSRHRMSLAEELLPCWPRGGILASDGGCSWNSKGGKDLNDIDIML
jgi:hypothetical protein